MAINDPRFDASYKYIWFNDNGPWSVRFTAWYVAGLLHRQHGSDVANAHAALENMFVESFILLGTSTNPLYSISVQMNYNFTSEWYGDYKLSPDGEYFIR
jgi:hypothetical protein